MAAGGAGGHDEHVGGSQLASVLADPARVAAVRATGLLDAPAPRDLAALVALLPVLTGAVGATVVLVDVGVAHRVVTAGSRPAARRGPVPGAVVHEQVAGATRPCFSLSVADVVDDDPGGMEVQARPLHGRDGELLGGLGVAAPAGTWTAGDDRSLDAVAAAVGDRVRDGAPDPATDPVVEVSGLVHDLRTPFSVLRNAAQLLAGGEHPAEHEQLSRLVERSAEEIEHVLEDLLVQARPADAPLPIRRERIDLVALCADVAAECARLHGDVVDVRGTDVEVFGDERAIRRVVRNLVENARRHGRPPVSIEVGAVPGAVHLSVLDAGSPPQLPVGASLFDRFETGRSGRPGSGLGLHIVRRLVEAHDGVVDLRDRADRTEFRVELPQRS